MPSGFYPNLPDPVIANPIVSMGQGYGMGQKLVAQGLKNQASQIAVNRGQRQDQALEQFDKTKNVDELIKYDPQVWMKAKDEDVKRASALFDLTEKATPYLLNATDPRMFHEFGKEIAAKGAPQSLVQGFMGTDLGQMKKFAQSSLDFTMRAKKDMAEAQSKIEVGAKKELAPFLTDIEVKAKKEMEQFKYQNVTAPSMRLETDLKKELQVQAEFLKEKYSKISDNRVLQKEVLSDLTRMESYMTGERIKAEAKLDEQFAYMQPNPKTGVTQDMIDAQKAQAKEELRRTQDRQRNELIESWRPILESKGIALPAKREIPTGPAPAGTGRIFTPEQRQQLWEAIQKARQK
jgi:hypothetical protein